MAKILTKLRKGRDKNDRITLPKNLSDEYKEDMEKEYALNIDHKDNSVNYVSKRLSMSYTHLNDSYEPNKEYNKHMSGCTSLGSLNNVFDINQAKGNRRWTAFWSKPSPSAEKKNKESIEKPKAMTNQSKGLTKRFFSKFKIRRTKKCEKFNDSLNDLHVQWYAQNKNGPENGADSKVYFRNSFNEDKHKELATSIAAELKILSENNGTVLRHSDKHSFFNEKTFRQQF